MPLVEKGRSGIKLKERSQRIPSLTINGEKILVTGKWLRFASIASETWQESLPDCAYESLRMTMKSEGIPADIFTFTQKIPDVKPKHRYPMRWENAAVIPLTDHDAWMKTLSTDMRKDLRRAANRGVTTRVVQLTDELVQGIIQIHDETPTRQGKHFRHFGKDFATVKRGYSSFLERSEFIAAYDGSELIGIIKIIHVGSLACIMQILSRTSHYDKRPTNALIAKAVEVCTAAKKSYLTFGEMYYGKQEQSSLADFKIRNGFECVYYPRYFIPLTFRGRLSVSLNLVDGIKGMLPGPLVSFLVGLRSAFSQKRFAPTGLLRKSKSGSSSERMDRTDF